MTLCFSECDYWEPLAPSSGTVAAWPPTLCDAGGTLQRAMMSSAPCWPVNLMPSQLQGLHHFVMLEGSASGTLSRSLASAPN